MASAAPNRLSHTPPDCITKVLSYLSLNDVLSYSSVSQSSLRDVGRDLARRRNILTQPLRWSSSFDPSSTCRPASSSRVVPRDSAEDDARLLPSVLERLTCLSRSLPPSHRLREPVRELVEDLMPVRADEEECPSRRHENNDRREDSAESNRLDRFQVSLLEMRKLSKAHRLHASILASAICGDHHKGRNDGWTSDSAELTVTLENYVGDVLCAYFLMGHSAAGVVEGGASEKLWMDRTLRELSSPTATAAAWYRAWVFLQSTVLRTAPFSRRQRIALGIESRETSTDGGAAREGDNVSAAVAPKLIPPPSPFKGADKKGMMRTMSQLWAEVPLKITLNEFGRLGPTFRGRDMIQTQTVYPMRAISAIVAFDGISPSIYGDTAGLNPFIRRWREGSDAGIRWLIETHSEASKARPMTVAPPTVSIQCITEVR